MSDRTRKHGALRPDDEACWTALCERDPSAATRFVYAVRTTGIYCRPTCSSRRPLRRNVEFHATPQAARAAGFRPCLRCRPDDMHPQQALDALITRICRLIDAAQRTPTLAELACACGMSPSHLHRMFKARLGVTPKAYAAARRADRARSALHQGGTVTRAMYEAGYESHSGFYGEHVRVIGMTPSAYRSGARGETIRYALARCGLGRVLAAATDRGICAILVGDCTISLVRELKRSFAHAEWAAPDGDFDRLLAMVVKLLDDPGAHSTLPLDIRGTAFQRRVWTALLAIPPGTTLTYAELARRIGAPKAVRAVGRACAANVLAVAIPCHRVVRADGSLSGYRWGLQRKRALLDQEKARTVASPAPCRTERRR